MKENPNPDGRDDYQGDNFIKLSGDYLNLIQNENFMIQFNKKMEQLTGEQTDSSYVNTVAMPS